MQLDPEEEGNNLHFAAERKYLEERHVYIHLLVGTQFGQHWDDIKEENRVCCICSKALIHKKQNIFQLWMRVMGGLNGTKWEYAITLVPVCQQCKPSRIRRFSLLVIEDEKHFEIVYTFIHNHAFKNRQIEMENFLAGDRNSRDAVFSALVDNYLYRFTLIDSNVAAMCVALFNSQTCFYCKKESKEVCEHCKSLYFCKSCKANKHHFEVCQALQRNRLLHCDTHIDPIYFIDRTIEGRCLRFSPVQVETILL